MSGYHDPRENPDDTLAVHVGPSVLLFATPDDIDMLHPELESLETGAAPMLVALSLAVPDLAATAAWLDHHDIGYRRDSGGTCTSARSSSMSSRVRRRLP